MKLLSDKLAVFLVALSFLILAGCATTFGDLVRSKEAGEGMSRVYEVNADRAWGIAKRVSQWEGIAEIRENRAEGYMLMKSGADWYYKGTLIGVWIEPIDKDQSKVTVVTKARRSVDTFRRLSEVEFHKTFALFAKEPDIGSEVK
jgi:hypothetical protein